MSTLKVDTIQGKTTAGTVAMPSGMILETLQMTHTTYVNTASSSYISSGLTLAITPKFSSSKILVSVHAVGLAVYDSGNNGVKLETSIERAISGGATSTIATYGRHCHGTTSSNQYLGVSHTPFFLDSPSTTSAVTYTYKIRSRTGHSEVRMNDYHDTDTPPSSTLTLMEIKQ